VAKEIKNKHDLSRSFAPERPLNKIKWYSDGLSYFADAAKAIKQARKEILITDWFFSPELMLTRGNGKPNADQLYKLLKEKAHEKGVPVKVLLYAEMGAALPLLSARVKRTLEEGNDADDAKATIEVLTHSRQGLIDMVPGIFAGESDGMWSHHEKLLICDQELAFVGGIDLAFGRFDTNLHPIIERHPDTERDAEPANNTMWPGPDYYNQRTEDFNTEMIENPYDDPKVAGAKLNRKIDTRMPWHDIHMAVVGPTALDVARHFMQRWNRESREVHGTERQ
jgi:phospholipase D1/2